MSTSAYPNDADGDALRRIAASGSDMSRPMRIDFHVAAKSEASAEAFAAVAHKAGYRVAVSRDSGNDGQPAETWTVTCASRMLATHESVTAGQDDLYEFGKPHGAIPDGWGTFGNV